MAKAREKITQDMKIKIFQLIDRGWKVHAIRKEIQKLYGFTYTWQGIKKICDDYIAGDVVHVKELYNKEKKFKKLKKEDLEYVKLSLVKNCNKTARAIQRGLLERGAEVHVSTVKRAIKAVGFVATKPKYCQMIRRVNKEKRVAFCKKAIKDRQTFSDAIYSDETTIQLHQNKTVAYRPVNGIAPSQAKPKHPLKMHLWGGITKRGPTPLLMFDGIMRKEFYTHEILEKTLLPFIKEYGSHTFIQDNDPKHTSKYAKSFMENNSINWERDWPAESPDLNPIEMIWHALKLYVGKRNPTTKEELQQCCEEYWAKELTPEVCTRYIEHNFKVYPVVVEIGGSATSRIPDWLFNVPSRGKSLDFFEKEMKTEAVKNKLKRLQQV